MASDPAVQAAARIIFERLVVIDERGESTTWDDTDQTERERCIQHARFILEAADAAAGRISTSDFASLRKAREYVSRAADDYEAELDNGRADDRSRLKEIREDLAAIDVMIAPYKGK
jgi:hypothetical protein